VKNENTKKIKQHYVWKYYLRPWAINNQIICQREGKVFKTALENVAQKRNFYRMHELSKEEIEYLRLFFENIPPTLKQLANGWIDIFKYVFDIKNMLLLKNTEAFDTLINNFEEEFMCEYENMGRKYLETLQLGNTSFFSNEKSCMEFILFLTVQYFRTEKIQKDILKIKSKFINIRIEKMWYIMRNIFATNVAGNIYVERNNWEIIKLENNNNIPFITGDQPIVNILSEKCEQTEKLAFYYPVTPTIGILLKEKKEDYRRIENLNDVLFYNNKMAYFSDSLLFFNTEDTKKCLGEI